MIETTTTVVRSDAVVPHFAIYIIADFLGQYPAAIGQYTTMRLGPESTSRINRAAVRGLKVLSVSIRTRAYR